MVFNLVTLFPRFYECLDHYGVVTRARDKGLLEFRVEDLRAHGLGAHKKVDDTVYGGGAGMLFRPEPVASALRAVDPEKKSRVILFSAAGAPFTQDLAREFALLPAITLIAAHYEGVDARIRDAFGATEISVGPYVLSGGESAALIVLDAVARLFQGVVGKGEESTGPESFSVPSVGGGALLEHDHFTKPAVWEGREVPGVLLSGNHGEIARWRREESIRKTAATRPEMMRAHLSVGGIS